MGEGMTRRIGTAMDDVTIRPARLADIRDMQHIEIVAGRAFIDVGLPEIAGDEPLPTGEMAAYIEAGRAWVATAEAGGRVVGYVLADGVDGNGHVEQVSVHPELAGRRIGSRLIDTVGDWAMAHQMAALTLTTFREVPWNAPYYERLGFQTVEDGERGPELVALMGREAAHGLEPARRVAMIRGTSIST